MGSCAPLLQLFKADDIQKHREQVFFAEKCHKTSLLIHSPPPLPVAPGKVVVWRNKEGGKCAPAWFELATQSSAPTARPQQGPVLN